MQVPITISLYCWNYTYMICLNKEKYGDIIAIEICSFDDYLLF